MLETINSLINEAEKLKADKKTIKGTSENGWAEKKTTLRENINLCLKNTQTMVALTDSENEILSPETKISDVKLSGKLGLIAILKSIQTKLIKIESNKKQTPPADDSLKTHEVDPAAKQQSEVNQDDSSNTPVVDPDAKQQSEVNQDDSSNTPVVDPDAKQQSEVNQLEQTPPTTDDSSNPSKVDPAVVDAPKPNTSTTQQNTQTNPNQELMIEFDKLVSELSKKAQLINDNDDTRDKGEKLARNLADLSTKFAETPDMKPQEFQKQVNALITDDIKSALSEQHAVANLIRTILFWVTNIIIIIPAMTYLVTGDARLSFFKPIPEPAMDAGLVLTDIANNVKGMSSAA